jgi:ubiquitin C-terminal hydrolase
MKKITTKVKFPMTLDFTLYCGETCIDLQREMRYDLFGVIVHKGTLSGGHYIAFVKRHGQWYIFNDELYEPVTESMVLQQEAYLLFY